ncbi:hypothetical protein GA0115257_11661, partial [Streptomyces sp. LcepLS]
MTSAAEQEETGRRQPGTDPGPPPTTAGTGHGP